ncbi:MAG: helix-turn-helix domain-containing protein [Bacilli bacterium]|nr:helix-turn-helix domain-containing protein [Bacillota bacterium]MBQ2938534.1 helix-turn-helix domain-containing protein [Clostridia bacterium]MBQ6687006.1 helix-turn-helix domain-containing protein [Bacilli bacterium]MBQ7140690.1 helix-turn-helix domain-containing protein [Bacilli bacterium]MBQ9853495.1 helix-turn-helix domain-containing protein [Bacilli bacterium]
MNETIIYTVKEIAKILHTSPNYVYKLIDKGYLPAIKLGSIKILKSSLDKFLEENEGNDLSDVNEIKKLDVSKEANE